MITILSGVGLLLAALAGFSLFSLKMPKGQLAMSGMANAAVATFLVEAIHKYITGDLLGLSFFRTVGETSGSLGGVAAAIMVPLSMGANPVLVAERLGHESPDITLKTYAHLFPHKQGDIVSKIMKCEK